MAEEIADSSRHFLRRLKFKPNKRAPKAMPTTSWEIKSNQSGQEKFIIPEVFKNADKNRGQIKYFAGTEILYPRIKPTKVVRKRNSKL